ncbi:MAG: hypothetical protein RL007_2917 [Bacteroidota bacterium]
MENRELFRPLVFIILPMPKISVKAGSMPASPIRKLVPFADKAKK